MTTGHAAEGRAAKWFEERVDSQTGEKNFLCFAAAPRSKTIRNKGTCFTLAERADLGLSGILPPAVSNAAEQEARAYENYLRAGDEIGRYLFLACAARSQRNPLLPAGARSSRGDGPYHLHADGGQGL